MRAAGEWAGSHIRSATDAFWLGMPPIDVPQRSAAVMRGGGVRGAFDLSAWRFGDGDSKRYIQSAWGRWIPAFAGMTRVSAGMKVVDCRNDEGECRNDGGGLQE